MSAHSAPLHCPYCGGEQLHPHGETHGGWECRECLRAFAVKFLGLLAPAARSAGVPVAPASAASSPPPGSSGSAAPPDSARSTHVAGDGGGERP